MRSFLQITGFVACVTFLFACALYDTDSLANKDYFWAINTNNNKNYNVLAELLVTGEYCNVWAETKAAVKKDIAQKIADEYDNEIYSKIVPVFGSAQLTINIGTLSETKTVMEFTDYFGNEDGKICILLLDIPDSYVPGNKNSAYVAGYFHSKDFFNISNSNRMDMIYIDTNPGLDRPINNIYGTIAHELQHMLNFITSRIVREAYMDTWIDEGLSESAEWVYAGRHSDNRIDWFNNDPTGWIGKGNNFFVWNNYKDKDAASVLDDYSTAYLFFQWLRLQAEDKKIYSDIITSDKTDYNAVLDAINKYTDNYYDSWDMLLKTWLAANYIKNNSGEYGYKDDSELIIVTPSIPKDLGNSISLYPGEGVYSLIKDSVFTPPDAGVNGIGPNIKYAGLSSSFPNDNYNVNNVLLTYNSSTSGITYNIYYEIVFPNPENGTTTSSPLPSVSFVPGRFASDEVKGPHRIGIQDMLSRNGKGINFLLNDFSSMKLSGFKQE